jgi:hypothetical protein
VHVARFWEAVRIPPEKWVQHPYGDGGGGFWVVGVLGSRVVWFNDLEHGFNVSDYKSAGKIADYWCDQHPLEVVLQQLLYFVQTGIPLVGRAGPPVEGVYPDA